MEQPLVSVICLCYNQKEFVEESVESVLNQTYATIQLIIVDDASTDGSGEVIQAIQLQHPSVEILLLSKNVGNCAAFNIGLAMAKGEFVIDLAADDSMMPDRVTKQVNQFKHLDPTYGVVFSDAEYIDAKGKPIRNHYQYLFDKGLLSVIPQGDIYRQVLSKYFIASPTMMIRKSVFDKLGGYDENLVYEDFDFWLRSSRDFYYSFLNESLTKIRKTERSMSTGWYKQGDQQLHSTYLVCCKAVKLNRDQSDEQALLIRVRYELKQAVFSGNKTEALLFYRLLKKLKAVRSIDLFFHLLGKTSLPLHWIRDSYHYTRYR